MLAAFETQRGKRVLLAPITHSEPSRPGAAIPIPAALKVRLGLDNVPAWIICDEWNVSDWPGVDLRPVPGRPAGTFHYGMLPPGLYEAVRQLARRLDDAGKARKTARF